MSKKFEIYSVPDYQGYVLEDNEKNTQLARCFASKSRRKIAKELETNDCQ